jgi:hypothetical protein
MKGRLCPSNFSKIPKVTFIFLFFIFLQSDPRVSLSKRNHIWDLISMAKGL